MKTTKYDLNALIPTIPAGVAALTGFEPGHAHQHLVPQGFGKIDVSKDTLRDYRYALEDLGDKGYPLLFGPTGSGKTAFVKRVCEFTNRPLVTISCNSEMEAHSFFGQYVLNEKGGMEYRLAALANAFKNGFICFLDEIDNLNPDAAFALKGILSGGSITIPETGEVIARHPEFKLVAAANTNLAGDETGLYTGQSQSKALARHFFFIPFGYMPMEQELGVLKKEFPNFGNKFLTAQKAAGAAWVQDLSDKRFPGVEKAITDGDFALAADIVGQVVLEKILKVANVTRDLFKGNPLSESEGKELETVIDTGSVIAWVHAVESFAMAPNPLQYALERVVTLGATRDHKREIHQIAENEFGDLWQGAAASTGSQAQSGNASMSWETGEDAPQPQKPAFSGWLDEELKRGRYQDRESVTLVDMFNDFRKEV